MSDSTGAFVKGGLGCLGLFLAVGLLAVIAGGNMRIDAGGACMLFVIGGVIGLVVLAIYRRGYAEGRGQTPADHHTDSDDGSE